MLNLGVTMKVLVMEKETVLRHSLTYLLERRGLEVEETDLDEASMLKIEQSNGYDAIVFNGSPIEGRRPSSELAVRAPRGTRLVCFSDEEDRSSVNPMEVDAHLPFPFSSSELLGALLGMK